MNAELRKLSPGYIRLLFLSSLNPMLYMAVPIYTQQIVERVALSRNEATLWTLFAIVMSMMAIFGALQLLREETLKRLGIDFDRRMTTAVFDAMHKGNISANSKSAFALNDMNSIREFISGHFLNSAYDAFWSPLFIVAMYLIHPVMGLLAFALILKSIILTVMLNKATAEYARRQQRAAVEAHEFGSAVWRNAEPVRALGMLTRLRDLWFVRHTAALGWQAATASRGRPIVAIVRFFHLAQPVIIYTIGCVLFLNQQVGIASMMMGAIIMLRAMGPIEHVITNWRQISQFRGARDRLDQLLEVQPNEEHRVTLPRPEGGLIVSRVIATPPDSEKVVLNDISFSVAPGRVLGVLGSSGAGKSSLSRILVGIWRPRHGSIALGDHDLSHWHREDLGKYIGFMPQDIELLPGTLGQNISRFDPDATNSSEALLEAVQTAGLADLIRILPHGLNTMVGGSDFVPSGGQRQRIALARAVYGRPHLVVLDEPNSNLDANGETALTSAIIKLKQSGAIVVVVTHKMNFLSVCDDLLVLNGGVVQGMGPRAQILDRLPRQRPGASIAAVEVPKLIQGGRE